MPLDIRIPLRIKWHTLNQRTETLKRAVQKDENTNPQKRPCEAPRDEKDAVVQIEDASFYKEGRGLINHFHRK